MSPYARPFPESIARIVDTRQRRAPPALNRSGATVRNPAAASLSACRRITSSKPNASCTITTPGHGPSPDGLAR